MTLIKLIVDTQLIVFTLAIFAFFQVKPSFSNIQNNNSETKIKAKSILVKRKSSKIEFIEDATIENNDTSILADKVIVFYDEKKEDSQNSIKEARAINNVKIFNQEFVATGESGVYNPKEESFTIQDNVVFNNGSSIAKGEKFIYDLKNKKGILVGKKHETRNIKDDKVIVIINEEND